MNMLSSLGQLATPQLDEPLTKAADLLRDLLHPDGYVGEVYSLGYE